MRVGDFAGGICTSHRFLPSVCGGRLIWGRLFPIVIVSTAMEQHRFAASPDPRRHRHLERMHASILRVEIELR